MTGTRQAAQRRPRFKRRNPPPFNPTRDDRLIVNYVAEHRFLRSTHVVQLLNRPADKVIRRLQTLYHNGYLDRPRAQRELSGRSGNAPIVYALGRKAALLFGEPDGIDWTEKNRSVTTPYMAHTLMVADFMVALEIALRSRPDIRLLRAADIEQDVRQRTGIGAISWTMTAPVPGEDIFIAAKPDRVFGLEFTETGRRNYFLLEADRSTMPINRASLEQSSYRKKLLAYDLGHQAKRHVTLWGIPGFRVLTITKSAERIQSMIDVLKGLTGGKGSNVFLFAQLSADLIGDPVLSPLLTGRNQITRIAPQN